LKGIFTVVNAATVCSCSASCL